MGDHVIVKEEDEPQKYKDDYFKYKESYLKYTKDEGYLKEESAYIDTTDGDGGGGGGGGGVDATGQVGGGLMGVGGSPSTSISSSNTSSSTSSLSGGLSGPPLTSTHVQQLSSLCPPFPEAQITTLSGSKDDQEK
ncbi:hypothetical protein SK128_005833, partial [Halocaridina rubra]